MIRYRLECKESHVFEAWFKGSAAYDRQAKRGLITCPECGSSKVDKSIMAPSIAKKRARRSEDGTSDTLPVAQVPANQPVAIPRELMDAMRKLRQEVEKSAEYVGPKFADEARKIHYEESPSRGIYGEATADDVEALKDEGIDFYPLPRLPEDRN